MTISFIKSKAVYLAISYIPVDRQILFLFLGKVTWVSVWN